MRLHYQVRKDSAGPPDSDSARALSNSGFLAKHPVQLHSGGASDRWLGGCAVGPQGQRVCSGADQPEKAAVDSSKNR